ncbi:MAG: hypothetical protein ACOX1Y_08260 [Zhaonellaceae bacterium]
MACSFSKVGKGIPIRDAVLKVTGELEYIDDLKLPHMLYGKILFSPIAMPELSTLTLPRLKV